MTVPVLAAHQVDAVVSDSHATAFASKSIVETDNPPLGHPRIAESDDNYPFVLAHLDERHRVISCRDDLQWIVQNRRGASWRGTGFFRTKAALLCRCGGASPEAAATLARLPDRYVEGHRGRLGGA